MSNFGRAFHGKGTVGQIEPRERQIAETEQNIANQIFNQTAGLRSSATDTLQSVLAGQRPDQFRIFAPEREAVEAQYGRARENIIATTPARGGQLSRLLTDADLARAGTLSQLEADIRRQAFNQALGVGFGAGPAVGLGAFANAAQTYGTVANRNEAGAMGKNSAFGSVIGGSAGMLGVGAAGCWIAAALYGDRSIEFELARRWIFTLWRGRLANAGRWLYLRYGERASHHPWLVAYLRPLFDRAVRNARHAGGS